MTSATHSQDAPSSPSRHGDDRRGALIHALTSTIIKLKDFNTIIGSDHADIVIADDRISAPHCQVQQVEDQFRLYDMNSKEGTFVNGTAIRSAWSLADGDTIRVGSTELEFRWLPAEEVAGLTSSQKVFITP